MPAHVQARILIVDDEPEITSILSDLFYGKYHCTTAGSAEEALERLAGTNYELVVSDITMPGMSGLDMIPHVRGNSPNTVVVMISGMQTVESAIDALRLGAFDYVMKPFDLRQVEAVVKRALEHQDLITAKQRYEDHLEELVELSNGDLSRCIQGANDAVDKTRQQHQPTLEKELISQAYTNERLKRLKLAKGN